MVRVSLDRFGGGAVAGGNGRAKLERGFGKEGEKAFAKGAKLGGGAVRHAHRHVAVAEVSREERHHAIHVVRRLGRPMLHDHPLLTLDRSEDHTSELQSLMRISYAVFCLKKKKKQTQL